MLNMTPQLLHVVDPLLSNKHGSAFEADQAEGFLVDRLHMATKAFLVGEGLL